MEKLNISELLKHRPIGLAVKLYSPLIGDCRLKTTNEIGVAVESEDGKIYYFHEDGTYFANTGECLLFPTKEKTWENWQDSVFDKGCFITDVTDDETYFYKGNNYIQSDTAQLEHEYSFDTYRFSTTDEISGFLKRLMDNGYKYDAKTNSITTRLQSEPKEDKSVELEINISRGFRHEYKLTKSQFDAVKPILDMITKKK